jgi:hypothetical protein
LAASFSIFENDVLSLHFDVQPPHHVGDAFLHVLMAAVGEGEPCSSGGAGAAVTILSVLMTMG